MLGYSDNAACWICDRLLGLDFDLGPLGLTEEEVAEQLGLRTDGDSRMLAPRAPLDNNEVAPSLLARTAAVSQCRGD
jgi:hypothetical protein